MKLNQQTTLIFENTDDFVDFVCIIDKIDSFYTSANPPEFRITPEQYKIIKTISDKITEAIGVRDYAENKG